VKRTIAIIIKRTSLFNTRDYLLVLFSELPALIYFSMLSLMVLKWIEITYFVMVNRGTNKIFGELKPVVIGVNLALYVFVAALLAMYYLLPVKTVTYSCTVAQQDLLSRDIVALVYKGLFFLVCSVMAIAYPFYARKLAHGLMYTGDKVKTSFVKTLTIISSVASTGLFLQSLILIYQTIVALLNLSFDLVIVSVFVLISEILPTLALMWMSRRTSKSASSTTSGSKKTSVNSKSGAGTRGTSVFSRAGSTMPEDERL